MLGVRITQLELKIYIPTQLHLYWIILGKSIPHLSFFFLQSDKTELDIFQICNKGTERVKWTSHRMMESKQQLQFE